MPIAAKMLVAWLLAIVAAAPIGGLPGKRGAIGVADGLLGIGLVVGLPMLVFAAAILPTDWAGAERALVLFAGAMGKFSSLLSIAVAARFG
ncbi:hypothetical protein SAMN06297144_1440 [Sphingomonas guangdongensis]|uniref:Uncharacterized protein n=1 Tax=Sphingomonas guangdongensis TaxID=1141890 RepID=A0A285QGV2_9SPHN|nr:hypothetical protein [Sphingomonas guangdongensis]SOB81180.1 hypothetical protein SAMN06297144_1440 [Sphingomonas guangdongensis]